MYTQEIPLSATPLPGAATSVTAFVGATHGGPDATPTLVTSYAQFEVQFGGRRGETEMNRLVEDYFLNGGALAIGVRLSEPGNGSAPTPAEYQAAFEALDTAGRIGLLVVARDDRLPDGMWARINAMAAGFAASHLAFYILDAPVSWESDLMALTAERVAVELGITGDDARFAAVYCPRLDRPDPADRTRTLPAAASGAIAGIYARIDATRGVWKAPAGLEASFGGNTGPALRINGATTQFLGEVAVNTLRAFPAAGTVVWGARTLIGGTAHADEYRYVPVRRLANYIAASLADGLQWAVFEPNGDPLWAHLTTTTTAFMQGLWAQGALHGTAPHEAFFVKCGATTHTADDTAAGRVNVVVGFAAVRPAEFILVTVQLRAAAP